MNLLSVGALWLPWWVSGLSLFPQKLRNGSILSLETQPLIGGPSWLPIHVQVRLQTDSGLHKLDLIPQNATNPEILMNLVLLQSVPAERRHLGTAEPRCLNVSSVGRDEIHLLRYNCWSYAFQVYQYIQEQQMD